MILSRWDGKNTLQSAFDGSFEARYDVVIAGLGTAGAVAAAVAAKGGLSVLGLESNDAPGGTATGGHIYGYCHGVKGGFYCEMDDFARACVNSGFSNMRLRGDISAYAKIHSIAAYHQKYGVESVYDASVVGVFLEGNRAVGVRYVDDTGCHDIGAEYVIDCTGDGLVCQLAGCEMQGGRAYDGRFQPYSNIQLRDVGEHQTTINIDAGYLDQYDPLAYGDAVVTSAMAPHYLPDKDPQEKRILAASSLLGMREGRRIVGEETVTFADWLAGKVTKQPAFYGFSNIDNHGKDSAFEDRTARDWTTVAGMWSYMIEFPVPAGVLIPKGFLGLLCAGRQLSVDHNLASALRMKDEMGKTGEVAAELILLARRFGCNPKEVPYAVLREELMSTGCLKQGDCIRIRDDIRFGRTPLGEDLPDGQIWLTDQATIFAQLASDRPGHAIWSAYVLGEKIAPRLIEALASDDANLRKNAALALGLQGRHAADEILLEMAASKSGYVANTSRIYNPLQAVSAISLCGRLGLEAAMPILFGIVEDPHYADDIPLEPTECMETGEEAYFQLFSHAMMALLEIGEKHKALRSEIQSRLQRAFERPDCSLFICLKAGKRVRYDMRPKVVEIFERLTAAWSAE